MSAEQHIKLDVTLRPEVTGEVVVTVRNNPADRVCLGQTLLVIHGLAHTAATWNPFIDELFSSRAGRIFCRVVAVDLPGHGLSGLPRGTEYGTLLIEDYVTAVQGVLDGLRGYHIFPAALIGHSMGGLIIEGLQAKLLAEGSSLAHRYRIHSVFLLSPVFAREQRWAFADESDAALTMLKRFIVVDPTKGMVLRLELPEWHAFPFFTTVSGELAPTTPSIEEISEYGYASDEAYAASAEIVGVPAMMIQRLSVGTTPFALRHGTLLFLINPSQDLFNNRDDAKDAYVQLTGDTMRWGFIPVDDTYAVHDLYLTQPKLIFRAVQSKLIP